MHPQDPDGLLTSKDLKEIESIKESIETDRREGSNNVEENIASDYEQLKAKLKERRNNLKQ